MNSCLYEGKVMHARFEPVEHKFIYPLFMFYVDLDEVPEMARKFRLISHNRFNLFSFWDKDHAGEGTETVREKVMTYLAARGVAERVQHIRLLTHMRTLGHVFNPVSFYFCSGADEKPVCAIAEVENTYHEKKMYYLNPETLQDGRFRLRIPKYFYVSPYIELDASFDFNLKAPEEELKVFVDDYKDENKFFVSSLVGRRFAISDLQLVWYALRFPFITLQVLGLIHWQATKLWLRGVPHFRKADHPELQKEAYHVKSHS